jgi:hypothetical protein
MFFLHLIEKKNRGPSEQSTMLERESNPLFQLSKLTLYR